MHDPITRHVQRLARAARKAQRRRIAQLRERNANRDMREGLREVAEVG